MSHNPYGEAKDSSSSESEPVSSGGSGSGESSSSGLSEPYGFSSGSSGMSGSTGSSESSGGSSSSGGGGCSLVSAFQLKASDYEFSFDLTNAGTGAIEVTDLGFNIATPTFDPPAPFTIPEGGFVVVTMTTVLPNTGGEVSIGNDCSGYLFLTVP